MIRTYANEIYSRRYKIIVREKMKRSRKIFLESINKNFKIFNTRKNINVHRT